MIIKFGFCCGCKDILRGGNALVSSITKSTAQAGIRSSPTSSSFNLREEYANAFRTESYNEFWSRVIDQTILYTSTHNSKDASIAAARLPSYRLFVENLLDPDQPTVKKTLTGARGRCTPGNYTLLSDYYSETAGASLLCSLLLQNIQHIRLKYRPLKAVLKALVDEGSSSSSVFSPQSIEKYVGDFSKAFRPFCSSSQTRSQFAAVQDGSASLLRRLELSRRKAKAKLRFITRLRGAAAFCLIAVTAVASVVSVFFTLHVMVALAVALPSFLPLPTTQWPARAVAQLDGAAKGAYILSRDLDTISRLVDRLRDEVEHMLVLLRFCFQPSGGGGSYRRRLTPEVVRQLWKNDESFSLQLDELEEHLYLCFMTINRVRSLVLKEVMILGREKVHEF